MFGWIKGKVANAKERVRIAKEINPKSFRSMAREISELADACSQVCSPQSEMLQKVERIKGEMEQLTELTRQPEFKKLSVQRRMELRESMLQSKEQILDSMQAAPSPTKLMQ
ncbi:hypothetical protein [Maridesulfovibrio salexigens]|uniref:Uncharacterized protein n=1 Tax=Maridesulfovibrio salexigens (strain ATCC 14822 / DSM 2638 / NCIMB 8403 / VKM B-1763) TaxID=526222 RepID=C6C1R1_MARSD|nr:hypothetical protein [Maridesulfovibrio salexigens]ACS79307.1 conserved hypothetical protein [Maridesulfovibrio salexigens DSM 2638]